MKYSSFHLFQPHYQKEAILYFHIALVCMDSSTVNERLESMQTALFLPALIIVVQEEGSKISSVWKETVFCPKYGHLYHLASPSHTHIDPFMVALTSELVHGKASLENLIY